MLSWAVDDARSLLPVGGGTRCHACDSLNRRNDYSKFARARVCLSYYLLLLWLRLGASNASFSTQKVAQLVANRPVVGAESVPQELGEIVLVFEGPPLLSPPIANVTISDGSTRSILWWSNNSIASVVFNSDLGFNVTELHYELPMGLLAYERFYNVEAVPWAAEGQEGQDLAWSFRTESEPSAENSAAEEASTAELEVYGIGVFVTDITDIDLRRGVFGADIVVFLLRYYRVLDSQAETREAMDSSRLCRDTERAEKFRYLRRNNTKRLSLVNARVPPSPHIVKELDTAGDFVDHFRVQAEWSFTPLLSRYPFQSQELPLAFELVGDSVARQPAVLLCALTTFSGFAPRLTSFDGGTASAPLFRAHFEVGEMALWPPLDHAFRDEGKTESVQYFQYPMDPALQRSPTRSASRLQLILEYKPPLGGVALELAPPGLIALSGWITLFLNRARADARMSACTTALLAAVVQHASMRGRIPSRTAILTDADIWTCVCEAIILTCFLAAALANGEPMRNFGVRFHAWQLTSRIGLCSPVWLTAFALGNPHEMRTWVACATVFVATLSVSWVFWRTIDFSVDPDGVRGCRRSSCCHTKRQHRYIRCSVTDEDGFPAASKNMAAVLPT